MNDTELTKLETQIEALMKAHQLLKAENSSLRQKLVKITQERADLLERNQKASTKVKRIISQLRNDIHE